MVYWLSGGPTFGIRGGKVDSSREGAQSLPGSKSGFARNSIAPLLGAWLGYGLEPKVVVAALIVFFPVMTTTASGLRGVDRDLRDVARVFGANWAQTLVYLELPVSARSIFSGEKIGAALAVTGAFVAELLGANQGLYMLIQSGQTRFDYPLMYVGVVALMIMGGAAYGIVSLVERAVLKWAE